MKIKQKLKPIITLLLVIIIITLLLPLQFANAALNNLDPGSYNIIGLESKNYELDIHAVRRDSSFTLNNEKLSFYMLGCDLISSEADRLEFKIRSSEHGAKFVFIAPEAGRKSGKLQTKDFYTYASSILRVKDIDKIIYQRKSDGWQIILGEDDILPQMWLEEKNGSNEKLASDGSAQAPFIIDLENYTIKRENSDFVMHHVFSPKTLIWDIMDDPTITFKSSEIMLRTYETRLSEDNDAAGYIFVDRKPSACIIGTTIRFTSDSDDGANLAIVTGVDENVNKIYIKRVNEVDVNMPDEGTWLRCYSDYTSKQVVDNEYPKVYLEPTTWGFTETEFENTLEALMEFDPTGLMAGVQFDIASEEFGYGLRGVTYSYDGLNFIGGLTGAFDIGFDIYAFGWNTQIRPTRIDYSSMANSILDEVLRINTYKREAIRFYFNPLFFKQSAVWPSAMSDKPDEFPLTFRLYFDKNFELYGGNMKLYIPGNGIPLPGGLIYIDYLHGGFRYPQTFDVGARFTTIEAGSLDDIFRADADMTLSLDQKYFKIDGSAWIYKGKIQIGDFKADVGWDYYTGLRYKGINIYGQTGIEKSKVGLIADFTFKIKRYKSNGQTKKFVGGSGSARVEAFGYTFAGVKTRWNTSRVRASVKVPWIGWRSVEMKYADVLRNISSLSANGNSYGIIRLGDIRSVESSPMNGVATLTDEYGNELVLMPEATKIIQPMPKFVYLNSSSASNTLNLPAPVAEAGITIDYTDSLSDVTVTLPNGTTKEIIIVQEGVTEDTTKLYAMDYELDDTTKQMFIQIKNAMAGNYVLNYTGTATATNIYEITQIPQIKDEQVNAVLSGDIATLSWEIEQPINGDVRYHLSMVELDNGEEVNTIPIYQDLIEEDDTVTENYIPTAALIVSGNTISTSVKLNDNLKSGEYAFRLQPVLYKISEDNLYGNECESNSVTVTHDFSSIVRPVSELTADNIGNGIVKLMWRHNPAVFGWDINVKDMAGNVLSGITVEQSSLSVGQNLYIDPLSAKIYVFQNFGIDSNIFVDTMLDNLKYGTDYTFGVNEIVRTPYVGPNDLYNIVMGYTDMNVLESQNHEGDIVYFGQEVSVQSEFIEEQPLRFYAEIYEEGNSNPLFTGDLYEEDTGQLDYSYDVDTDTEAEGLNQIDPGALVLRTNAMDAVDLISDQNISKIGIEVLASDGSEVVSVPAISIDHLQTMNWTALLLELQQSNPSLTQAQVNNLQRIYNAGAFTSSTLTHARLNFAALVNTGIINAIDPGRYTIAIESYNDKDDQTLTHFEIVLCDINPTVFIESIEKISSKVYSIIGFANGAQTVAINGVTATVHNGMFELQTSINSDSFDFSLVDEFGNTYGGTLDYDEYTPPPVSNTPDAEEEEPESSATPTPSVAAVSVASIEFNTDYAMLNKGANHDVNSVCPYVLTPSDATNKGVIWHSSNPDVASISGSIITAKDVGRTVITVTTDDNRNASDTMIIEIMDGTSIESSVQTGHLEGRLVDNSQKPLAKYSVTIYSNPMTEITDADGKFRFENVPYDQHTLVVCNPEGVEIGRFLLDFCRGDQAEMDIDNEDKTVKIAYTNDTLGFKLKIKIISDDQGIDIVGYDCEGDAKTQTHQIREQRSLSLIVIIMIGIAVLAVLGIILIIAVKKRRLEV